MRRKKIPANKSPYYSNAVGNVTFAIGAEIANVRIISLQFKDVDGRNITHRTVTQWFLMNDATGDTVLAAAASGGVASGVNGWVVQDVAGLRGAAGSEANGTLDMPITEVGVKNMYLLIRLPDGKFVMSTVIAFA